MVIALYRVLLFLNLKCRKELVQDSERNVISFGDVVLLNFALSLYVTCAAAYRCNAENDKFS